MEKREELGEEERLKKGRWHDKVEKDPSSLGLPFLLSFITEIIHLNKVSASRILASAE